MGLALGPKGVTSDEQKRADEPKSHSRIRNGCKKKKKKHHHHHHHHGLSLPPATLNRRRPRFCLLSTDAESHHPPSMPLEFIKKCPKEQQDNKQQSESGCSGLAFLTHETITSSQPHPDPAHWEGRANNSVGRTLSKRVPEAQRAELRSQFVAPTRSASGPAGLGWSGLHFHLILFMRASIKGVCHSLFTHGSPCVFVDGLPVAVSVSLLLILRGGRVARRLLYRLPLVPKTSRTPGKV